MTRLQQARLRRAKLRVAQAQLEAALDGVISNLRVTPAVGFEVLIIYALDGLMAQGVVNDREQALHFVARALSKRGLMG
jgi:hypothetical protein